MSHLEAKLPIKLVRIQQPCPDCCTDSRVQVEVFTLDANGLESIAVLEGCTYCKSGLCREDS